MPAMRFWTVVKLAVAILVVAWGAIMVERFEGAIRRVLRPEGPRMKTQPLPLGSEIAGRRERKDINRVSQEYGRVKVQVDVARAKGQNVANLDKMLVFSLSLARQKKYDQAFTLLNRIAMDLPRAKEPVVAARLDDPLPEEPELKAVPVRPKSGPRPGRRAQGLDRRPKRRSAE